MGLLPDMLSCGLRVCLECRERLPRRRLQRKPLVSDPSMHHGTCVTHVPWCMCVKHVPWCMSESLTRHRKKTFPAFPAHAQPPILRIWHGAFWKFRYLIKRTIATKSSNELHRINEDYLFGESINDCFRDKRIFSSNFKSIFSVISDTDIMWLCA